MGMIMVDVTDLGILGANWTSTGPMSADHGDASRKRSLSVPEPAVLPLVMLGVLVSGRRCGWAVSD